MLYLFQRDHIAIFKDTHARTQREIEFQYYYFFVPWTCTHYQSSDCSVTGRGGDGGDAATNLVFRRRLPSGGAATVEKRIEDGRLWYGHTRSIHTAAEKASLAARILSVLSRDKGRQGKLTSRCEAPVWVASLIGPVQVLRVGVDADGGKARTRLWGRIIKSSKQWCLEALQYRAAGMADHTSGAHSNTQATVPHVTPNCLVQSFCLQSSSFFL